MFLGMDWSTVWLKFGRQKSRSQTTGSSLKESDNHFVSMYLWLRNELVRNAISAFGDRVMVFEANLKSCVVGCAQHRISPFGSYGFKERNTHSHPYSTALRLLMHASSDVSLIRHKSGDFSRLKGPTLIPPSL